MKSTVWRVVLGSALVGAAGLELFYDGAVERVWDYPLFFAVAGLVGCFLLSFLAKGMASPAIDVPEDYYGERDGQYDWSTESPAAGDATGTASWKEG